MGELKQDYREWFLYAEEDLKSAKILASEKIFRASAYHAQQCAEKALKSYLVQIRKTHDLVELTQFGSC